MLVGIYLQENQMSCPSNSSSQKRNSKDNYGIELRQSAQNTQR